MESIFKKTTHIRYTLGDRRYRATGIFFEYANNHYLITNRHVVEHEHNISPEFLRIIIKPKTHKGESVPRKVQLFDEDGTKRWFCPNGDEYIDLAIIPLRFNLVETGNEAFSSENILPENKNLQLAGSSAIVVGYPERFGQGESNTPVARSGQIATSYGSYFQDKPQFLLEAKLQDGMSGSPVLLKPSGLFHENQTEVFTTRGSGGASRLLGIHSGPIEFENRLDLHSCWYARLIRQTVADKTK